MQTTFIQGWVGGPVMIAFDFHEMSWLELPVKSLGQKVFAGTGNFVKLIFWSFTFHARMVFCCGHFGLKDSITFVSNNLFPCMLWHSLPTLVLPFEKIGMHWDFSLVFVAAVARLASGQATSQLCDKESRDCDNCFCVPLACCMAASLPRLLLRRRTKRNMLSDHDLWCFALSAKVGWVGCISECGAQMVWKEPKVRRHHLQSTFIQGLGGWASNDCV